MDNLQRLAYPQPIAFAEDNSTPQTAWGVHPDFAGFTKLELGALMIAQGLSSDPANILTDALAKLSVAFAKVVLEEANK